MVTIRSPQEDVTIIRLCLFDELPDGRSRGFDPLGRGRDTMFIVRRGGDLHAYRNHCPHYDRATMPWKKDEYLNGDRTHIRCAAHGALFRIEDGECIIGPCLGMRLFPIPLSVENGAVLVDTSALHEGPP